MSDCNNISKSVAFLFDLDGVLIDSEREYSRIWGDIDREFPTGVEGFAKKIKGTTLTIILSTYYPVPEVRSKVERRLEEREKQMVYNPTPGCVEFLQTLKSRGIPMAMVTSSNDEKMSYLWRQRPEFKPIFDIIISGDDVKKSKPDPEGYLLAAKRLGVAPERCAVVEDSLQGVRAGRASGAFVIGMRGTVDDSLLAPHCDMITDNLSKIDPCEIIKILEKK